MEWDDYKENVKPLNKKSRVLQKSPPINQNKISQTMIENFLKAPPEKRQDLKVTRKRSLDFQRIQATIDLHGFTCAEADAKLIQFFNKSQILELKMVLVITGKGRSDDGFGILRRFTIEWFERHSEFIVSYAFQDPTNEGAFCVHVRTKAHKHYK